MPDTVRLLMEYHDSQQAGAAVKHGRNVLLNARSLALKSRVCGVASIPLTGVFNTRPSSVFRHLPQCRGGGCDPPGVSKLSVVELSGKTADCSRRVLAIGSAFFDSRSKIDPVLGGQRSNFREIGNFQLYIIIFQKLLIVATYGFHQRVPRSILNNIACRYSFWMEYM